MTAWEATLRARVGAFELDVALHGDATPLALMGPNGSGKTTLLRALAGALRPAAGHVIFGGRCLYDHARGLNTPSERRRVGYVPQGYGLFPHVRVLDNVAFGLAMLSKPSRRSQRRRVAAEMLEQLECAHLSERLPHTLSGGEQQRVALARALVLDPAILLLDEPLAALDVGAKRSMRAWLAAKLKSWGRPAILVTHDVRDVEALGASIRVLDHGRLVQGGSLADLRAAPANEFVAELCGG